MNNTENVVRIDNLCNEFLKAFTDIAGKATSIVWFGLHPRCDLAYSIALDLGVKRFEIVDNDIFKIGTPVYPFNDTETTDDSRMIRVKKVSDADYSDSIVVMANTHYNEICEQLKGKVDRENIYNLYDLTQIERDYYTREEKLLEGKDPLTIEEIQHILLELLINFRDFCDRNGLRYCLAGGTMIGAFRHKGFIPWDNDADVFMPLEDYLKFIGSYKDTDRFKLATWSSQKDYIYPFARIVDQTTTVFDWFFNIGNCRMGLALDIYPLVGYPEDRDAIRLRQLELYALKTRWHWYYIMRDVTNYPLKDMRGEIEKEMFRYGFNDSKYIGLDYLGYQKPWVSERKDFETYIEAEFEGEMFKVPTGYNDHMSYRYGEDWAKLPLVKNRWCHPTIAFRLD